MVPGLVGVVWLMSMLGCGGEFGMDGDLVLSLLLGFNLVGLDLGLVGGVLNWCWEGCKGIHWEIEGDVDGVGEGF